MDTKKLFIICGAILGGLLLLLLVVWLITLSRPKYITYEALENRLNAAAKAYVKDHEEQFSNDNTRYTIWYQTLANAGYISPIEELLSNPEGCTASVAVTRINGEYSYVPYLNCADRYTTIELYKQVLLDNKTTNSGSGLYKNMDGSYYFKGKNVNNYVAFGSNITRDEEVDYLWQIMSIGKDNTIKMRATFSQRDYKTYWDDRFNKDQDKYVGYNRFDDSLLQETLEKIYTDSNIELLNSEEKSKLVARHLCIGPREENDTTKDGSTECSKLSTKAYYFSTLTPYEYLRASLDADCTDLTKRSCSNDNFFTLNNQSSEWLITAVKEDNYQVYTFDGFYFEKNKAYANKDLYLVVELNDSSFYKSGDGTLENPYRLKLAAKKKAEDEE